jgi:signal-transduction protein with cAMP-binding, CBS, and nucleotidyltransferase domain
MQLINGERRNRMHKALVEIFESLTDDELAALGKLAREEIYEAGACICIENEVATKLYIVREGRVAILINIGRGSRRARRTWGSVITSRCSARSTVRAQGKGPG